MSDEEQPISVFLDRLSDQPKNEETRECFRQMLRNRRELGLEESVDRIWDLPPMILDQPSRDYVTLLLEARELYVAGYFYSCVAMCGIVGERLAKDLLRASVMVEKHGVAQRPIATAFDQLERVEVSAMVRFLKEADLLDGDAAKAWDRLGELRNQYAHARGKESQADALEAIQLLATLVEGTVSVFKDFEVKDGAFVRREKGEV